MLTPEQISSRSTNNLNIMKFSTEFLTRHQGKDEYTILPKHPVDRLLNASWQSRVVRRSNNNKKKLKLTIDCLSNWRCREEATSGMYRLSTMLKHDLSRQKLVPVCSPLVTVKGTKVFTNSSIIFVNSMYDGSKPEWDDTSTLVNLFAGTAYIMLMRGVEDEELRIKTLKPAKKLYNKFPGDKRSNYKLNFDLMSGVISSIPPVFISLMYTFLRAAYNATSQKKFSAENVSTLLEVAGTNSKELVTVINSFDVERAEEIFLSVLPYLSMISKKAGQCPFNNGPRRKEVLNMLKRGLKNTVKRPTVSGDYKTVGRYSLGINNMLRNNKKKWKITS